MGNRATVIFTANGEISPAVYLHWNGGPESVYAIVAELDRIECRADACYECARFVQAAGDYFDSDNKCGTLSLGLANGPTEITVDALGDVRTDHGDNGFYVFDRTTGLVRRFTERHFEIPDSDRYGFELVEWAESDAARERERAEAESYYLDIRAELSKRGEPGR